MNNHKTFAAAVLACLSVAACNQPQAPTYDLVINNGRVMDPETNFDAVANVGVKDGRIAVIAKDAISGKETVDATGLVVSMRVRIRALSPVT